MSEGRPKPTTGASSGVSTPKGEDKKKKKDGDTSEEKEGKNEE